MMNLIKFTGLTMVAGGIALIIFGVIVSITILKLLFIVWGVVSILLGMTLLSPWAVKW